MRMPLATLVALLAAGEALAQRNAADVGARLLRDPAVQAALAAATQNEPQVLEEQIRICEIAAPPFKEEKRALAMKAMFERLGLENVRIDEIGNVLGERPGKSERPHFVMAAHLDTVFPEGTDVRVKREGAVFKGPGIGDDCRGLAVLIGVIRALSDARVVTEGSLTFVANVGEE